MMELVATITPASRPQLRQSRADNVDRPGERDRHRPIEVVSVDLEEVPERDRHRVGNDDVEPTERSRRRVDRRRRGSTIGDVGREHVSRHPVLARPGGGLRERCLPARDQRELGAPRAKRSTAASPTPLVAPVMRVRLPARQRHVHGLPVARSREKRGSVFK